MFLWIVYDISDDKTRTRVAEICKDMGLFRAQKSVFFGKLDFDGINRIHEKMIKIMEQCEHSEEDSIFILPVCKSCMNKMLNCGKSFDIISQIERECIFITSSNEIYGGEVCQY